MKTKLLYLLFFIPILSSAQVAPYPDMSYDAFLCEDEIFKTQTICLNERINEEGGDNHPNTWSSASTLCQYEETILPAYINFQFPSAFLTCNGVCCGDGTFALNYGYDNINNRSAFYTLDLICSNNSTNVAITKENSNCWSVIYNQPGTYLFSFEITVRHGREIEGYYCEDTTYYFSCGQNRTWKQFTVNIGNQYPCNDLIEDDCNLIQNGGFEEMINCPTSIPGMSSANMNNFNFDYLINWEEITDGQEPNFLSTCGNLFGYDINNALFNQYTEIPPQPLPSGDNYLKFSSSIAKMGQYLDLCPNQKYEFSFYGIKRRTINPNKYLTMGGLNTSTFPTTSPITNLTTVYISDLSLAWNQYSTIFTSPSAFNAISISGNQIMIDNLSLIPVDTLTYTFTQNTVECDSGNLTLNIPGCYGPYDISMIVNGDSLNFNQVQDGYTIQIPLSSASNIVTVGSITNSTGCTTILNSTNTVVIQNPGNAAFSSNDFCFGQSNTINFLGDQGEFSLVNDTTGAIIHPVTGILSNITPNINYIIEHTVCLDHQFDTIVALLHDADFTSTNICEGALNEVVITGESNGTFTLLQPNFGAQINPSTGIINGSIIGNQYTIQYIVGVQCADTSIVQIEVNSLDDPSFTTSDFCYNETNTITINGSTGGIFTLLNVNDQAIIHPASGQISNMSDGASYTIQYLTNGMCPDSAIQIVNVLTLPTVTLSGVPGDLCINDSLPLFLSFTGTTPWNVTGSNNGSGFSIANIPTNSTTYYVDEIGAYSILTVTDAHCTNSGDTIHSIEMTGDSILIFSDNINGCAPTEVSFWSNVSNEGFDCLWNFGDGTFVSNCDTTLHNYTQSGNYVVQLTVSSPRCDASVLLQNYIEIYDDPIAIFNIDPANPSIINNLVLTTNNSIDNIQNVWLLNQSIISIEEEPKVTFPAIIQENLLCLIVENIQHCYDTTCLNVFVNDASIIYLPNAFIPDNDGLNDLFKAEGSNLVFFELQVFDRWGEKIFESHDISDGWDGNYNGNKAQLGVYSYRLLYRYTGEQGNHLINGHVSLIR